MTPVLCLLSGMDELMEVSFSPLAATGKPLSRCGKCHRFMKYIQVCAAWGTVATLAAAFRTDVALSLHFVISHAEIMSVVLIITQSD